MLLRGSLKMGDRNLSLGGGPVLMGIVNATPDSFSDGGELRTLDAQVARAHQLVDQGAGIVDVGGESGITIKPPISPAEEIERVCPLIERLASTLDVPLSVDTYKPEVAHAALAAGAVMVNDVSGLFHPELADVCADAQAALVVTHTRVEPKQRLTNPHYDDIITDVLDLLKEKSAYAQSRGVARESLIVDPGPDLAKTPAQTVELLRRLPELHELGYPLLLAVSRKDFIGALTLKRPADRLAGTLAAIGHGVVVGASILRVHEVGAVRDFLKVRDALAGESNPPADLRLPNELRWQGKREGLDISSEALLNEA